MWIVNEILPGEMIVADSGYRIQGSCFSTPSGNNTANQRMQSVARSRHETVNARFKKFAILATAYRGDLNNHYYFFTSIAIMCQIAIDNGHKLFQLNFADNVVG